MRSRAGEAVRERRAGRPLPALERALFVGAARGVLARGRQGRKAPVCVVEEDDAERHLTILLSGSSPGWLDGLRARWLGTQEDLEGRCPVEAFMWPEAR